MCPGYDGEVPALGSVYFTVIIYWSDLKYLLGFHLLVKLICFKITPIWLEHLQKKKITQM